MENENEKHNRLNRMMVIKSYKGKNLREKNISSVVLMIDQSFSQSTDQLRYCLQPIRCNNPPVAFSIDQCISKPKTKIVRTFLFLWSCITEKFAWQSFVSWTCKALAWSVQVLRSTRYQVEAIWIILIAVSSHKKLYRFAQSRNFYLFLSLACCSKSKPIT